MRYQCSASVWSVLVGNNVSKWLSEDVCILRGITEIKHLHQWFENSSRDNAGNEDTG